MGGGRRAAALRMLAAVAAVTPALGAPATTVDRTIRDRDGDNLLEYAPGEAYTVVGVKMNRPWPYAAR